MSRSCISSNASSCSACCTHLKIDEPDFQKPAGVPCTHLESDSYGSYRCGIYTPDMRPNICREFMCGWAQGLMGEEDRPDRSSIIVLEPHPMDSIIDLAIGKVIGLGMEVWNLVVIGKSHRTQSFREALSSRGIVFVNGHTPSGNRHAMLTFWEAMSTRRKPR
jgi:hypothetical protein